MRLAIRYRTTAVATFAIREQDLSQRAGRNPVAGARAEDVSASSTTGPYRRAAGSRTRRSR